MLGATEAAVTCRRRAAAWEESWGVKTAPALSAWSSAAQKCFFFALHNSLVLLMFQPGGGGEGRERGFPSMGATPESSCVLWRMLVQ